jgi:hypothetical protein
LKTGKENEAGSTAARESPGGEHRTADPTRVYFQSKLRATLEEGER